MEHNAKRKIVGGIIYVVGAFMLVTLLCVAIITALTGGLQKAGEKSAPDTSLTEPATDKPTQKPEEPAEDTLDVIGKAQEGEGEAKPSGVPVESTPESYVMPVGGYISKHHDLELAVYSLTMDDYRVHSGIDIECGVGQEVAAFADGTVSNIRRDPFMGYCMTIEHSGGMKSHYMNLSASAAEGVAEGSTVSCGQIIGYVGESAAIEAAQSPHLHFEVTVNGAKVDPLDYFEYDPAAYAPDTDAEG